MKHKNPNGSLDTHPQLFRTTKMHSRVGCLAYTGVFRLGIENWHALSPQVTLKVLAATSSSKLRTLPCTTATAEAESDHRPHMSQTIAYATSALVPAKKKQL
jgi:hypothetical protein